ncbi:MFS transporter [Metabacillus elymi]|nr:MFS transporter [Metabacillus sp. KUDC1714]QNF28012.1 MFS transporter [Metabacillus sp. KUDC1714]
MEKTMGISQKIYLWMIGLSVFFVMQDGTLLYVLLPIIQTDLQIEMSHTIWIMNGYILPFALLMPLVGVLSQRIANQRLFFLGILLFSFGSLCGALSPSFIYLLIARIIQGIGSSIIVPISLVLMLNQSEKEDYTKVIGIWGALSALAASAGPILGGIIGQFGHWKVIFFVNLIVFLIILICSISMQKHSDSELLGTLDFKVVLKRSILLFTMLLNFGVGFILNSILYVEPFILSNFIDSTFGIAIGVVPLCISIILAAVLIRRLEKRFSLLNLAIAGVVFLLCGLLFIILSASFNILAIALANLFVGLGLGLIIISSTSQAMIEMEIKYHCFVSSMINMSRLLGAVIGSTISSQVYNHFALSDVKHGANTFYTSLLLPATVIMLILIYQAYWQRKNKSFNNIQEEM